MPGRFLTNFERKRLKEFPDEISMEDIITYFTLSEEDIRKIKKHRQPHNQLGFAIQLWVFLNKQGKYTIEKS